MHDTVAWCAPIAHCISNSKHWKAIELYKEIFHKPNEVIFLSQYTDKLGCLYRIGSFLCLVRKDFVPSPTKECINCICAHPWMIQVYE